MCTILSVGVMCLGMLLIVQVSASAQDVRYVLPNGTSQDKCPAQPCLTLDQYTQQTGTYFTTGATFHFLAGNHSLQAAVTLTNISDVTFRGEGTGSQVKIVWENDHVTIQCISIRNLTIEKLTFIYYLTARESRALIINSSSIMVRISDCIFRGLYGNSGVAIASLESSIEILNCTFKRSDPRIRGGFIYAAKGAALSVSRSMFIGNGVSFGGAIAAFNATLTVSESVFIGNRVSYGGAIAAVNATLIVSRSIFDGNRASRDGGAIVAENTTLTVSRSTFNENRASHSGGAIAAVEVTLTVNGSTFDGNGASRVGGAIAAVKAILILNGSTFEGNEASFTGGAIDAVNATLTVNGSTFDRNKASLTGGAVHTVNATLTVNGSTFEGNEASLTGGAIDAVNDTLTMSGSTFEGNRASYGGAIRMFLSHLNLEETLGNVFMQNSADEGGAIACNDSTITLTRSCSFVSHYNINSGYSLAPCWTYFYNNTARSEGGALHIPGESQVLLNGTNIEFTDNKAQSGGAFNIVEKSTLQVSGLNILIKGNEARDNGGAVNMYEHPLFELFGYILFEDNFAGIDGGAIFMYNSDATLKGQLYFTNNTAKNRGGVIAIALLGSERKVHITGAVIVNNSCGSGGIVYIFKSPKELTLEDITAVGNTRSAVYVDEALVAFIRSNITGNTGKFGGGIYAERSGITMMGGTYIANNRASKGGGIYSSGYGYLLLDGDTLFSHNMADGDGGALYVAGTDVTINITVTFTSNTALMNGGAIFITASLTLCQNTTLTTSHNHASLYGGAIYHEDNPNSEICSNPMRAISEKSPECFLAIKKNNIITSYQDSAVRDGSFLYGGLLDKCRLDVHGKYNYTPYDFLITSIFNITSNKNKGNEIAAMPYALIFCDNPLHYYNKSVSISRGQRLIISVQIVEAIGITQVQQVTAVPGINARVHLNQVEQVASSSNCTDLTYNFYSSQDQDELRLTTRGSCGDTGTAQLLIGVTLLPCPHPFVQDNEECACDKRLLKYPNVNCTTDEHNNSYVTKQHGTDFWMSLLYSDTNGSYEGLILYKTCLPEYCKTGTVAVSMDDLDSQCDDNRGGVLCGKCLANYSLMLGSYTCTHCSNLHLTLLLPFAAAGIALVVFLSFLRLTVATAMINSVILYANVLQANRNTIFPANERNILTVFVAWMNLDLGFETCFYEGMTAYAQTWLQFAFPLYVWLLISLMILSSRYSITVSRLIGHNPIAVLATLILMSYTKLLKIVIEVYSSVELIYPDNQTVTVWLKDANVPYLQSWHLLLTVVTTLILVFFFLPYTLLLLLGYKLYRLAGRRYFRWVHRVRPLLESYYAPYNIHTRYWTGFLLLVRCVLYIIFSTYSLGNTNNSLLAIISTFTGLLVLLLVISICFSHQLYAKAHNNIMEISAYLNLIVLSAATGLVGVNPALVYSLVGLVFAAMLGIIVYHFHLLYIAKSQVWQQFRVKVSTLKEKLLTQSSTSTAAGPPVDTGKTAHDPPNKVTHSEIALREPLLQEN